MKLVISVACAVLALSTASARNVLQPSTVAEQQKPWFCHGLDCPLYDLLNKTDTYETRKYQPGAMHVVRIRFDSILHRRRTNSRVLQESGCQLTQLGWPTSQAPQLAFRSGYASVVYIPSLCHVIYECECATEAVQVHFWEQ